MLKGKNKKLQKAPHPSHRHSTPTKTAPIPPPTLNWDKEATLPITILIGFLGAGKTTLLKYALENTEGKKIAVIVNDLAEVNVDAALVKKKKSKSGGNRKMVELTNGCMCCSLKNDLLAAIRDLARKEQYEYLIIESSGVAEPLPVAEGIFNFDIGRGKVLADIVRLDAMITVVDAQGFLKDYRSLEGVLDREELVKEMGLAPLAIKGKKPTKKEKKIAEDLQTTRASARNHPISSLLAEQVEFCNILIINKVDLVSEEELVKLEDILHALNPDAVLKRSEFGQLPLDEILNSHLFNFDRASASAGWLKVLNGNYVIKAKQIGISNFVFKARRPFHPKRLWDLVEGDTLDTCVRSKGFFWLATHNDRIGDWAHAGENFNFSSGGPWFCTLPESEWPGDEAVHNGIKKDFDEDPAVGDRRQELVFIGIDLDEPHISDKLRSCLLTEEEEWSAGPKAWKSYEDPFATLIGN